MDNLNTSRFRKTALIVPILLLITGFFVMLALYVNMKHSQKETSESSSAQVCSSKQCLRSAGDLAVSMDKTVQPCDDFYQYVCRNWPREHPSWYGTFHSWFFDKTVKVLSLVPKALAKNTTGQPKPVERARDFYASCMDTGDIEKVGLNHVFDVLKSVNLPLLPTILNISSDADSTTPSFDWVDTVVKIKTQLDMHVFIGFDIKHNNSFENGLFGLTETNDEFPRSYKKVQKFSNNIRQSRLPLNNESIKMCMEDKHNTDDEEQQKKNANFDNQISYSEEYTLLKKYVKGSDIGMKINDSTLHEKIIESLKHYNSFNAEIKALQEGKNNINNFIYQRYISLVRNIILTYLKHLFNLSSVTFDRKKDKIEFIDDVTFVSVVRSVSKAPPKLIELYIWMKVVKALDRHTKTEQQPRSLYCSVITNEVFGMAVTFAIVEPDIVNVSKPKVLEMIKEIKQSLHQSISKAEWMDEKTKQASYEKITKMKLLVGIPEWFYDTGKLEEYYEGVEISRDNYFKNLLNVVQARLRKHLNKFREPDYFLWSLDPSTVNAAYNRRMNSISVPMVMMQHPFFDLGLDSLNYGNLGVILGHEVTHGFDNTGRVFDMNGNIVQWWSDDSIGHYVNLTQCFVDQYSSFCVAEIHKYVNGIQTLGENIADNGGLNQALTALKGHLQKYGPEEKLPGFEHMSSEQMFFLSFAHTYCGISTEEYLKEQVKNDVHAPLELRIRGTLQNSEEFARAWNCPLGSPMNPRRERCVLF